MTPWSSCVDVTPNGTYPAVEASERALDFGDVFGERAAALIGAWNRSGVHVNEETAIRLGTFYACVNVISTDVSSLPLGLYRRRGRTRDEIDDQRVDLLNGSPDGETTAVKWRGDFTAHALTWGNGFAEIGFSDGVPSAIYLMDPRTRAERDRLTKRLYYRDPDGATYEPWQVLHLAGLGKDGLNGYPIARMFGESIGLALAMQSFGASYFGNGAHVGLVFEFAQKLRKEAIEDFRALVLSQHQGSDKANAPLVLPYGAKVSGTPTTIDPERSQFVEGRKHQVIEVCGFMRVPPHKVANLDNAHLANLEASERDYWTNTIGRWAIRFEQALNLRLLTADERRAGLYWRHNLEAVLRGNLQARAQYYGTALDHGYMSRNEVRALEDMAPIDGEGGDLYTVQSAMTTLDHIGSEPTTATTMEDSGNA